MKVLFAATRKNKDPLERELYEMDLMNEILGFERSLYDLGLLTIAACTPPEHEVVVRDEYLAPLDYDEPADLVAISAKTSCVARAYEVAAEYRRRGRTVVLGGIHASLRPEEALEHVDCIVTGEAEALWPKVLADHARGALQPRYDADGFPPMDAIPYPRWDQLDHRAFLFHQIQTTRGCPFQCRFCSVPDISGQAFRFKPVEHVVGELRSLPTNGALASRMKTVYMVDDNFISRTRYTKELLEALVPMRRKGEVPDWSAETTLNVAKDEALLDLFREAGCTTLIIGFESISQATLESMNKGVNFCLSYQDATERIHQRGMSIVGNFIVGFDTDTRAVFKDTRDFVFENNILYPFFSILTPMPGTELFEEFKAGERLDHTDWAHYDTRHVTFEPKHMSREELMDGYAWLYEQCYTTDAALDNLARYWARPERAGSNAIERLYVRWRASRSRLLSDAGRDFFGRALARAKAEGSAADMAQLLYYLDSGHFAECLEAQRSSDYAEHARCFEAGGELPGAEPDVELVALQTRQWEDGRLARAGVGSELPTP